MEIRFHWQILYHYYTIFRTSRACAASQTEGKDQVADNGGDHARGRRASGNVAAVAIIQFQRPIENWQHWNWQHFHTGNIHTPWGPLNLTAQCHRQSLLSVYSFCFSQCLSALHHPFTRPHQLQLSNIYSKTYIEGSDPFSHEHLLHRKAISGTNARDTVNLRTEGLLDIPVIRATILLASHFAT